MTFSNDLHNGQRLIQPATEPANKHWLMLQTHRMYMAQVERDCPEWFAQYEDADALIFDADTALDLAMTAPSEFTAGLLVGRALVLKELAALGRPTTATETV
jgi:hypothetical protein